MQPVMPVWLSGCLDCSARRSPSPFLKLEHIPAESLYQEEGSHEDYSTAVRSDSHESVAFRIVSVTCTAACRNAIFMQNCTRKREVGLK